MGHLFLLDLDRTAFKTDQHFDDFCTVLEEEFGIDSAGSRLKEHQHHLTQTPSPYSPLEEIRYDDSIAVSPDEVRSKATEVLSSNDHDYLYPDAGRFIKKAKELGHSVVIITVGNHDYQGHKKDLVPELKDLDMIVTSRKKAELLSSILVQDATGGVSLSYEGVSASGDGVTLIDDRAKTFTDDMPDFVNCVRIKREGEAYTEEPTPPGVKEIESLEDFADSFQVAA